MGSYGIGVGRLLGCLAEAYHDERGLLLPVSVAPYEVIIVGLLDAEEVRDAAEQLYEGMQAIGLEVLYDDRDAKVARAGEKFGDADLIGIPVRITVSKRSMKNGGAEMKLRREAQPEIIPLEEVVQKVQLVVDRLKEELTVE